MAPTTNAAGRKKKVTGAEPTRRSTRTPIPREIFSGGVTKARAPAKQKRKPTVADKVEGAVTKVKGTITKKPAVKAAGTKKMKGTDGKGKKAKVVKA